MTDKQTKRTRSCVSCGMKAEKGNLYRLVRVDNGLVHYDSTGKISGRGAYVCSTACFNEAIRTKRLSKALRISIDHENHERIVGELLPAICEAHG